MINQIINLNENDPMYKVIAGEMEKATDNDLIIVARSYKNRKDDAVQPIEIKNGIYFYVAYDLPGKLAFLGKVTPSQIYKAKANTVARAVVGTNMEMIFGNGTPFVDWEYDGQPMIVATSETKTNGAGLLYCGEFLKGMRKKMGDFYILPSAVHEIILVPEDFANKEDLTEMVRGVNATQVSDEEYLADRAFEVGEWI